MEENTEYVESFAKYEERYISIKKVLNSKMWSVTHRDKSTPQMDIPIFSGSYQNWVSFKDLFLETIHKNSSLSDGQKMQFLKSKLKGEAEKLVQHLHISADNYQTCWQILSHRYNNIKLIFSSHANTLLNLSNMQQQTAVHIKKIHDTTKECLYAIQNLGVDISTWDPMIVHIISQKLDPETHEDYIQSLSDPRSLPSLKTFLNFLENKFTSLEASRRKFDTSKSNQQETAKSPKNYHSFKSFSSSNNTSNHSFEQNMFKNNQILTKTGCPLCNKSHGLFRCNKFIQLRSHEKLNVIKKLNYCVNCLYDHRGNACISEKRCRVCEGSHNSLLHEAFSKNQESSRASHVAQNDAGNTTEVLLATALIKVQSADGSYQEMRALIDQGSQTSLITDKAAKQLGLPQQRCKGVIFGVGVKENNCKGVLTISIASCHSEYQLTTDVFIMKSLVNKLPNQSFVLPSWSFLSSIQLADSQFNISRPVDLLLGADVYSSIILSGIIREDQSMPIAQQTQLGWILCGNIKSYNCNVVISNFEDIKRFWTTEDISEECNMSQEELECVQFYQETTSRQQDGRYIVKLPLKTKASENLGESKHKAIAQFINLERKFKIQENIARDYKAFIQEYISLGHMHRTSYNEMPSNYLPHHCVQRTESTTTSLRVVFNASARTTSGFSLNDVMMSGPNLQKDLFNLILRWRTYQYALNADIEKMYRQINVHPDDQGYQKIIWRNSAQQPLEEYKLSTVTYGTKSAPFLAMMTLNRLANDEGHHYSAEVTRVLKEDFFMDDLLSGSHSLESARKLQIELITLLKSGGFNLRKWASNDEALLKGMSTQRNQQSFDFKHQESTKTLGLRWYPNRDEFGFEINFETSNDKTTKRQLLSTISKLFDPLGWLSPVSTRLKLLFQKTWLLENLNWDDHLPKDINEEWIQIKIDVKNIKDIKIPRWLQTCYNQNIQLHGFCDASTKAYACAIYCKTKNGDESDSVILVTAKARLSSPSKVLSLPRLELNGAHLLSQLMQRVQACLINNNIQTFAWTDSTAVLGWIQGDPGRWKAYVSNRVKEITNIIPSSNWHYVRSGQNPADCASRGISADQLKQHNIWWTGPSWLATFDESKLNKKQTFINTDHDLKKYQISKQSNVSTSNGSKQQPSDDIIGDVINKYSSWTRTVRVLAWILRISTRSKCKQPYLTIGELRAAKRRIIKYVQEREFLKDINYIKNTNEVHLKSKLLSLNPILDSDGVLKVNGRLRNAKISQSMMYPIIIPHNHHLSNLLIDHAHQMTYHGGPRLTLAWLRMEYWITKLSGSKDHNYVGVVTQGCL